MEARASPITFLRTHPARFSTSLLLVLVLCPLSILYALASEALLAQVLLPLGAEHRLGVFSSALQAVSLSRTEPSLNISEHFGCLRMLRSTLSILLLSLLACAGLASGKKSGKVLTTNKRQAAALRTCAVRPSLSARLLSSSGSILLLMMCRGRWGSVEAGTLRLSERQDEAEAGAPPRAYRRVKFPSSLR